LLYHESTFLESERERAKTTFHSTAKQAAQIAMKAGCKNLLLGHFSSRYANDMDFKSEAMTVFQQVEIADEGAVFQVGY
jgi:ribonuclease Z